MDKGKKYKKTNNDLQTLGRKINIMQHDPHYNPEVNSGAPEG